MFDIKLDSTTLHDWNCVPCKEYVDKNLFNDATIQDFIKKFGIEKILESIGEDKIQDFIKLKKIKKLKKDMK